MTATEKYFDNLEDSIKASFPPIFDSPEEFYSIAYLVSKNEHICSLEKTNQWEQRLKIIHEIQLKLKNFLNNLSLDGESVLSDIASDYFEDYVAYKEKDIAITNDAFLTKIRAIQQL